MNFSWHRVFALMLRLWYGTIRSFDRLTDAFYWVTIDLALWGITANYVQNTSSGVTNIFFMIVASVILWSVVHRGSVDLAISMLDELWNRNLINLFAAPISIREWLTACVIFGFFKAVIAMIFGSFVAYLFYRLNLFNISWHLLPMFFLLYLSGCVLGMFMTAVIIIYSTKVQALAWTAMWLFAPFSAIYFPLSSLPVWAQFIGKMTPTSYIFEEMRSLINGQTVDYSQLGISLIILVILLATGLWFIHKSFMHALDRGLAKIY